MAFFKFRNSGAQGNEGRNASVAAAPAESVESMRRRARHRLLGAAVLVLVGVIGFPLLFDTQPRPVSVDIPIEIPDRNKTKPPTVPVSPVTPPVAAATEPANTATRVASGSTGSAMITEAADGTEILASKPVTPAVKPEAKPETKPEAKPEPKPERKPEPKPEVKAEAKPKPEAKPEPKPEAKPKPAATDDGARAKALLDGKPEAAAKPAASDDNGKFVVQVGAFADAAKAKEVRQKLEKAGLKTYTHVARTADGERTRVRVGPFANRAEADKAAARVKGLSLSAAVLTL